MSKTNPVISIDQVKHLAKLANLPLSEKQMKNLPRELTSVLDYVSKIQKLNTAKTKETAQVTQQENVFREDEIEKERMLTQDEVLANAPDKHNGYFKVKAIFEE